MSLLEKSRHTLSAVAEAAEYKLHVESGGQYFYEKYPPPLWWKFLVLVPFLINPKQVKTYIRTINALKTGGLIFDQAFPRSDNPDNYHSTEAYIDLTDQPHQVLGWQQVEDQAHQTATELGLDYWTIMTGFNHRAEERGIDLEWHFHATPPNPPTTDPQLPA